MASLLSGLQPVQSHLDHGARVVEDKRQGNKLLNCGAGRNLSCPSIEDEIMRQLSYIREWGGRFAARSPELRLFV